MSCGKVTIDPFLLGCSFVPLWTRSQRIFLVHYFLQYCFLGIWFPGIMIVCFDLNGCCSSRCSWIVLGSLLRIALAPRKANGATDDSSTPIYKRIHYTTILYTKEFRILFCLLVVVVVCCCYLLSRPSPPPLENLPQRRGLRGVNPLAPYKNN